MEKTIKGKEVIAFKGMKSNMSCIDFQYEIGKSYKTDKAELCECGFHACLNPRDVLDYYYQEESSRYFKVKLSGEITKCGSLDTKVAATEITILEEITDIFDEVIKTTEWWKTDNVLDLLYCTDGFARVRRGDGLWNFIDKKGKLFSEKWFDWIGTFKDGFARVQRKEDKQYNLIDKQGDILSDEWFMYVFVFNEGFAVVQRKDGLMNYIDKNGKYLSYEWFNAAYSFHDGSAKVKRGDVYNFIDKQGKFLSNEWFNYLDDFHDELAILQKTNGEWCKILKFCNRIWKRFI